MACRFFCVRRMVLKLPRSSSFILIVPYILYENIKFQVKKY